MSLLAEKLKKAVAWSNAQRGQDWSPRTLAREVENGPSGVSVSHTYIRNLLSGAQRNPSLAAIAAIAHALGIPTLYFLPGGPDDIDTAVWADTDEAQYWLLLLKDLPPEHRHDLMTRARHDRDLDGLPDLPFPPHRPDDDHPTAGGTGHRRWLGRRKDPEEPVDEVTRRIITGMQGPLPMPGPLPSGGEEENPT